MSDSRAALVTGASSGIGLAIAAALGRAGYGVTIAARRPEKLEAAAKGLRDEGIDVHAVAGQLSDEGAIVELVAAHRDRFGRLDALVNNAGIGVAESVDGLTTKFVDLQLGVNIRAALLTSREALPLLRAAGAEHGKALVVNMASISGLEGWSDLSVYSATKAALIAFSRALQKEVTAEGIQVTAFCPGFVDTPMTDAVPEDQALMLRPDDIAEAVLFLLRTSSACQVPELVLTPAAGNRGQ